MSQGPGDVNHYLYEKIYTELKAEILNGKFVKGDWFPPERALKDRFNTTHLTVRNALAKLVLEGYIERYSGKGTIVIYSPNKAESPRPKFKTGPAHLILARIDDSNVEFLMHLEEKLRRLSIPVRFSCHHNDVVLERGLYEQAAGEESLIILDPADSGASLVSSGVFAANTIVINALIDQFDGPQILPDEFFGGREAVKYLADLGYGTIAHVSLEPSLRGTRRRQGYEAGLADCGIAFDEDMVANGSIDIESGALACRRILEYHPDCRAFFCAADEPAVGAMRCLRDAGLMPGKDCSVVGYGNTRLADGEDLTTVDPGARRMAELVFLQIVEGISKGTLPVGVLPVKPELRIRGSCGPSHR